MRGRSRARLWAGDRGAVQAAAGGCQIISRMHAHGGAVTAAAQSPVCTSAFVTASADGGLMLWDVSTGASAAPVAITTELNPSPSNNGGSGSGSSANATGNTARGYTCCAFDVTGNWVVAATRAGGIVYYSMIAGAVAGRAQVHDVPRVRALRTLDSCPPLCMSLMVAAHQMSHSLCSCCLRRSICAHWPCSTLPAI